MSQHNPPHYLLALDIKKMRPPQVFFLWRARCQEKAPRLKKNDKNANDPGGGSRA